MKLFLLRSVAVCSAVFGATTLATDANPFKAGQIGFVASTSRLDPSMLTFTTFRTTGTTQQGRHILGEDVTGLGGKRIVVDYDPANHVISLADNTPTAYGSKNTWLCVFDVRVNGEMYYGRAAHLALSKQTARFETFFKGWATRHPGASVQTGISAYTNALSPSDNTSCKLDLGYTP